MRRAMTVGLERFVRLPALALLAALASAPLAAGASAADAYPTRPIRLVVPFPPGGPADFFGRALGNALSQQLGQPIIIDNRTGLGGVVGTENVAKSASDGYSLLLASPGSIVIAPAITPKMPYDTFRDLAPITLVVTVPEAVVVIPKFEVKTLAEFVAYAKAHPGQTNMASTGSGSMPHLAGELLKREAGIEALHVPYRGAAPAINDMLAGQVDWMFADLPILIPHIRSGALIALALGSAERAASLPDLPTTAEAGYPKVLADNWYGLFAPAATPPDMLQKLNATTTAVLKDPALQAVLAKQGALAKGMAADAFVAFVKSEGEKWGGLAVAVGVKLE
jgi:tripartite-type tricarboxylate transporter receptor subunit TctC